MTENGRDIVWLDVTDVAKQLEAIAEAPDRDAATDTFASWQRANTAPRTQ